MSTTINRLITVALLSLSLSSTAFSQENSPFSRYGLGDLTNTQNILLKGMGGIAVAYTDPQIINFSNPASFANARIVTYDLGITIDARTLNRKTPVGKYNSTNFSPSYLAVAMPISAKHSLGLTVGFRPITRINYSVVSSERLNGIDSIQTLFEGSGGMNEAFVGVGKRWKNFSVGLSTGFHFGKRQTASKRAMINDTVVYYKANYNTTTSYRGAFLTGGIQYQILLNDTTKKKKSTITEYYNLRLGASVLLSHKLQAEQTNFKETYDYDYSGATYTLDSIDAGSTINGKINIPATYTVGFLIQKTTADAFGIFDKWALGADFTIANWKDYRYFNQKDATINSWQLNIGGQWVPDAKNINNYFSRIAYRTGFNIGKDYINADGNELKTYGISLGFGLPVRPARYSYQFTTINTAFEFGKRGSAANNITEKYFKLSVSLCLSDLWFVKRKYD
ncbi:MAG: hypothetical protein KF781_09070 [Chitinophagaceae bacterium]|nr:hypothetical protein [Chitinophagaceae bacterium]